MGDTVILAIKQFDYERSLIYGRILQVVSRMADEKCSWKISRSL